jgi:hypothetical protein
MVYRWLLVASVMVVLGWPRRVCGRAGYGLRYLPTSISFMLPCHSTYRTICRCLPAFVKLDRNVYCNHKAMLLPSAAVKKSRSGCRFSPLPRASCSQRKGTAFPPCPFMNFQGISEEEDS